MKPPQPYEYHFEDHSILLRWGERPVLQPLVRALPLSITPNHVTIAGHLCGALGFILTASARSVTPAVLVTVGLAVLLYTLADCIDGLFARHTRRTSPLGELLDHWLDAVTVPLVVLTLGLTLPVAGWLVFAGTVVTAFVHYATFVHGYRVGWVHLGPIGIIEGTCVGAAACVVTAVFGPELLGKVVLFGYSAAELLMIGLVLGGASALLSMRGLRHWLRDFGRTTAMLLAVTIWFTFGQLPTAVAAFLALMISAGSEGRVIRARLLRVPLQAADPILGLLVLAGAVLSLVMKPPAREQAVLALLASGYAFVRGSIAFAKSTGQLRQAAAVAARESIAACGAPR